MRTAETILHVIRERGRRRLPLERVYRLLFNRELYLLAFSREFRVMEKGVRVDHREVKPEMPGSPWVG